MVVEVVPVTMVVVVVNAPLQRPQVTLLAPWRQGRQAQEDGQTEPEDAHKEDELKQRDESSIHRCTTTAPDREST